MNLFEHAAQKNVGARPLAERMRPQSLDEILGQDHILSPDKALRRLLGRGDIPSLILWGPAGCGKTTLAKVMARHIDATFETLSAVMDGVKVLREVVERAKERRAFQGRRTLLFIDEIHRYNKAQQDALLPHVESGLLTLVGATTENPSFELNAALLSRCRVFVLEAIDEGAMARLIDRALADKDKGLGREDLAITDDAREALAQAAYGDARRALGTLEVAADLALDAAAAGGEKCITLEIAEEALQHRALLYDKNGAQHYDLISAMIKSLRGSDPDAATYYLVRMLESGEDPRFILRRLVIFASEDIGNADPGALQVAAAALSAYELVGLPEGVLPMTQAATYLACAPKSNAVIKAYAAARADVKNYGPLAVPKKLRNAPTSLLKNLGHGKDYKYPHDFEGNYVPERYLPEEIAERRYYQPSGNGAEAAISERLVQWRKDGPTS